MYRENNIPPKEELPKQKVINKIIEKKRKIEEKIEEKNKILSLKENDKNQKCNKELNNGLKKIYAKMDSILEKAYLEDKLVFFYYNPHWYSCFKIDYSSKDFIPKDLIIENLTKYVNENYGNFGSKFYFKFLNGNMFYCNYKG